MSTSSHQSTCSELNTSTPRKEKQSRSLVKSSLTLDFSDEEEDVKNVNQCLEAMVTEVNNFSNFSAYFSKISHTCAKSLWTPDLDDNNECVIVRDPYVEAMLIEAKNLKIYCQTLDAIETHEVEDDDVFDLRPLFRRDFETSCVLDLSEIFTEEGNNSELRFFENHFSKEDVHSSEIKAVKEITIPINVPSSENYDSMLPVMSDIIPTPSLGREFFRIFGKSTSKPHIKTSPQIKTEDTNAFIKLFKKKEPKPCEIADLTSKGDRPTYDKPPKKSNKKLKVKSKTFNKERF